MISNSELVLNDDGSIYHLHLHPEQIAPVIITVGDPDRVEMVSKYFDAIEFRIQKREFITHTGRIGNKRLTVISTGIGTDNIDIVLNELDALVNIDLKTRIIKPNLTPLTIVRLGTSGALHPEIAVDSFVVSTHGLGLEGLLHYYQLSNNKKETAIINALPLLNPDVHPYLTEGSSLLLDKIGNGMISGITATCGGFYGPQGRQLRLQPAINDILTRLQAFNHQGYRVTNFEMETAAIYGLSRLLGHQALSVNVILANRATGRFSSNPSKAVSSLITAMLPKIAAL
ncbi:MAG: nucleoside phosphorylase [Sphingobacteriales bacterium]|nr:MAG: nucleoside phosphorylase [Sphingobacteriales bacterium]